MAKSKIPYESLSISDKIEVKRKKIQRLFRDLPAERKQFADGLIYQFAVTTVTLERLVEEINAGDLIEDFKQGAQQLRRETPALKSYNTTIKSFTSLSKSLLDLLPEKTQKQAGEEQSICWTGKGEGFNRRRIRCRHDNHPSFLGKYVQDGVCAGRSWPAQIPSV